MKTEHYNKLEQKYWEGKTTTQEEQQLKEQCEGDFFMFLKEEQKDQLEWDFNDFLKKTEENSEKPIISLVKKPNKKSSTFLWLAASLVVLLGLILLYKDINPSTIALQDQLVRTEIQKQKNAFQKESQLAQNQILDSIAVENDPLPSDSVLEEKNIAETDILDKILPKRGRIKKRSLPKMVKNSIPKNAPLSTESPQYNTNYVIINGKRIDNEKEAINVTKYSLQVLSHEISKTIAETKALESINFEN